MNDQAPVTFGSPTYSMEVLQRNDSRRDSTWQLTNVPVSWFGATLIPGSAFRSYASVLFHFVELACPIEGCRIAYKPLASRYWRKYSAK